MVGFIPLHGVLYSCKLLLFRLIFCKLMNLNRFHQKMRCLFIMVAGAFIALIPEKECLARQDTIRRGITVTGNSRILAQLSTREGNYQEISRNYARWELNNTLGIAGIPLLTTLFLTKESNTSRKSITGFRIGLDAKAIARNKLYEKFRFLSFFPTLEAGNCRPVYSPLIFNGVNLRGVNVEFNPGPFYAAFATGRLVRAVRDAAPFYQTYERNLTFGRIGVGKIRNSYFAFSFLHAKDDPNSVQPDPHWYKSDPDTLVYNAETYIHRYDSSYLTLLPRENYVAGAELSATFFKKKLFMTGEVAGSLATANQNAFGLTFEKIPDPLHKLFDFNASSRVDYAWFFRSGLKLRNTEITGQTRYIGPGYVSLGTAYLRADVNQVEGNLVQYLYRKKITLRFYYKNSSDNLMDWKQQTSRTTNWGVHVSLRLPKAPWFTVLYSPYHSSYLMNNRTVSWDAGNLSLSSGHQLRMGKSSALTSALVSFQNGKNTLESSGGNMKNMNLMISETVNLSKPLSLYSGWGINDLETGQTERKTLTYNGKITYSGLKWMHALAGISHTVWKDKMVRSKIYFSTQVEMGKFGILTLQADRNQFENHKKPEQNYTEYVYRIGLAHRW